MADQLNMAGMSLNDSQHAPNNGGFERAAYIPPHLRGRPQQMGGPPMHDGSMQMNGGPGPMQGGGAWAPQGPPAGYVMQTIRFINGTDSRQTLRRSSPRRRPGRQLG